MRNMTDSKIIKEDIEFKASIRKCNWDSPISIALFTEINVRDNCGDFSTKCASVESLNTMLSQETSNDKYTIRKKKEQLGKSLMPFTHLPTYRFLIMDIINDPPPNCAVVTGIVINVSSGIL